MESREQRKESWHRLLRLFSFMALSIARFESTGTAGSQKANPTSSFFVYQRCPANLLLATFDRAGLIDLYPASCWRNIRSDHCLVCKPQWEQYTTPWCIHVHTMKILTSGSPFSSRAVSLNWFLKSHIECVFGLAQLPCLTNCFRFRELDATRWSDSKEY